MTPWDIRHLRVGSSSSGRRGMAFDASDCCHQHMGIVASVLRASGIGPWERGPMRITYWGNAHGVLALCAADRGDRTIAQEESLDRCLVMSTLLHETPRILAMRLAGPAVEGRGARAGGKAGAHRGKADPTNRVTRGESAPMFTDPCRDRRRCTTPCPDPRAVLMIASTYSVRMTDVFSTDRSTALLRSHGTHVATPHRSLSDRQSGTHG